MGMNVIDADKWNIEGKREALCGAEPDEQCANQPGRVVHGNATDVLNCHFGLTQRFINHWQNLPQVSASCDFRNHTAKPRMEVGLRCDNI